MRNKDMVTPLTTNESSCREQRESLKTSFKSLHRNHNIFPLVATIARVITIGPIKLAKRVGKIGPGEQLFSISLEMKEERGS